MFSLFERSREDGAPIELYEFSLGGCDFWRFTSSEFPVTYAGNVWTPTPISRSALAQATDSSRNALAITLPRNNAVPELFRISPPAEIVTLSVYGLHRRDLTDAIHLWAGRVLNAQWRDTSFAELQCEPVSFSLRRPGLRRVYQLVCPHVLYGPGCKVEKRDFRFLTTVTAISGSQLSVAAEASTTYPGGFIEWAYGDLFPEGETESAEPCKLDRRFIKSHSSLTFLLDRPFQGVSIGDEVALYPGCAHNTLSCENVFSNIANYGGMPFMPSKNPFSGDPIF